MAVVTIPDPSADTETLKHLDDYWDSYRDSGGAPHLLPCVHKKNETPVRYCICGKPMHDHRFDNSYPGNEVKV